MKERECEITNFIAQHSIEHCIDCVSGVNVHKCDSQFKWKIVLIEFDYITNGEIQSLHSFYIPLHIVA